jgi:hypothetical protein
MRETLAAKNSIAVQARGDRMIDDVRIESSLL